MELNTEQKKKIDEAHALLPPGFQINATSEIEAWMKLKKDLLEQNTGLATTNEAMLVFFRKIGPILKLLVGSKKDMVSSIGEVAPLAMTLQTDKELEAAFQKIAPLL